MTPPDRTARILALDTATPALSVALIWEGGRGLRTNNEANRHTEHILPLVDELLKAANLAVADLDAVAFGAGPGAFTGLRVACGVAQGLAWAAGKPVVPVGNLTAAARLWAGSGRRGRLAVVNDARMSQCYAAAFEIAGNATGGADLVELSEAVLLEPGDVADFARRHGCSAITGSALGLYGITPEALAGIEWLAGRQASALDIADEAAVRFALGQTVAPQLAAPHYVRNRVALTKAQREAGEKL